MFNFITSEFCQLYHNEDLGNTARDKRPPGYQSEEIHSNGGRKKIKKGREKRIKFRGIEKFLQFCGASDWKGMLEILNKNPLL